MTPESGPSLLRRVRWGNVARLGAALAALALVLAWPRLRPREPQLPPATVAPAPARVRVGSGGRVDDGPGGRAAGPRRAVERERAAVTRAGRGRRAARRRAERRRRGTRRAERPRPARAQPPIPRAPAPAPPPRPATPPSTTTAPQEFVFG